MTVLNKIIYYIIPILLVCLFGFWVYSYLNPNTKPLTQKKVSEFQKNLIDVKATINKRVVDKDGYSHAVADATKQILSKEQFISGIGYDSIWRDSMINALNIEKSKVISLTQIVQTVSGEKLQAVAVIDSMNKRKFEYQDKNFYVSYSPSTDSTKAGMFAYKYNQKLNMIAYNDKRWFLGRDKYIMDISTDDPNATINGVNTIRVAQPVKSFGAVLTGKTVFFPQSGRIAVGSQIRLRYKSLTLTGAEYYFPSTKKLIPAIGLEYDFLNY